MFNLSKWHTLRTIVVLIIILGGCSSMYQEPEVIESSDITIKARLPVSGVNTVTGTVLNANQTTKNLSITQADTLIYGRVSLKTGNWQIILQCWNGAGKKTHEGAGYLKTSPGLLASLSIQEPIPVVVVWQEIQEPRPIISISNPNPVLQSEVLKGSQNVTVVRFEVHANSADALATSFSGSMNGSYASSDLVSESIKLWAGSATGDEVYEQIGSSQTTLGPQTGIHFSGLNAFLKAGVSRKFKVTVDVSPNATSGVNFFWNSFNQDAIVFADAIKNAAVISAGGSIKIATVVPNPNPFILASLNFNGNTLDLSGNNRHATNFGGTWISDRKGNAGGAISLDGIDDYLSLGVNTDFHISGPMSVATWIKIAPDAFAPHVLQTSFIENTNTGSIFFFNQDKIAGITLGDGKAIGTNSRKSFHTNNPVPYGEWIHVVFVKHSETSMEIFVNGQSWAGFYSGNGDGLKYNALGETLIGKSDISNYTEDGFHFTKAAFDELIVYSGALSAGEVATLFNN